MLAILLAGLGAIGLANDRFPEELQWTWASDPASCEAELNDGFVIGPDAIHYYDGPEALTFLEAPQVWSSPKGQTRTYMALLETATSPGMGREDNRGQAYRLRLTLVGEELFVTPEEVPAARQFDGKYRSIRCPKKSYGR